MADDNKTVDNKKTAGLEDVTRGGTKDNDKGRKALPKLDLNITNNCNYRCVHCAFDSGQWALPELSLEELRKILTDTRELGGERFDITGGEPLVRKDVGEIISIGKELGYKIELVTNGSLLTLEKIVDFKARGLDSIAMSIDGPDYETYSRIRLVDEATYQKVMKAVDDVLDNDIALKINTVAFQSNYKSIPEITKWCIDKGVAEHGLYYYTAIGRGERNNELSVDPNGWIDFVRNELYPLSDRMKISCEFPFIGDDKLQDKETRCLADAEQYHLQILPDGNVYPCAIMASYQLPIANLHEISVKDIWKNKDMWDNYWTKANGIFCENKGCCVDFSDSFDVAKYDDCKFVCPLRKFYPGDIV